MRLNSISKNKINELYPATLERLGCLFASSATHFPFTPEPELLDCALDINNNPADKHLRKAYRKKKELFAEALENLQFNDEKDNQVIYMAHHIGCANEDLAELLMNRYNTPEREGVNSTEYVVRVLLDRGIGIIREASMSLKACKNHSFLYAVFNREALRFPRTNVQIGKAFDLRYEAYLTPHLKKNYKTDICKVHSELKNGCWFIEIMHGGTRRKELVEKDKKTVDGSSQPIEVDVLIYDPSCDDVRIHMQTKRLRMIAHYYKELSNLLYATNNHWCEGDKFDLNVFRLHREELRALLHRGEEALKNEKIGNVTLDLIGVAYGDPRNVSKTVQYVDDISRRNPAGLNNTLPLGMRVIPDEAVNIRSIELRLRYGIGKNQKNITVILKPREGCVFIAQIPGFEAWLKAEGISKVRNVAGCLAIYDTDYEKRKEA